jgi:hypothetical protein
VTRFPAANPVSEALAAEMSKAATTGVKPTHWNLGTAACAPNCVIASTSNETILILPVTLKMFVTDAAVNTADALTVAVLHTRPLFGLSSPVLAIVDGL